MDVLTGENAKQVQVLTGTIINREAIKRRGSTVNEGDIVIEAVRNVQEMAGWRGRDKLKQRHH